MPKFQCCIFMMKEVVQLGSGKSFGEKAIEEDKPRAATVYCRSDDVVVGTLKRTDYHRVIGDTFRTQMDLAVKCLRQFEIFQDLSDLRLKTIYYYFQEVNAAKDHILFKKGELTDGVYFLVRGTASVLSVLTTSKHSFIKDEEKVIATTGEYQILGLSEILDLAPIR